MTTRLMRWSSLVALLNSGATAMQMNENPASALRGGAGDSEVQRLTLLQINDTHAYFDLHQEAFPTAAGLQYRKAGGYARIATLASQIRNETGGKMLFGDSGDTFFGTFPARATQGAALVPILNALRIDAMTAHWEFVFGPKRFQELAGQLSYPVLATNVYDKDTGKRVFQPYVVKEVGGLKIGIIGIASPIVDKVMPPSFSEGLRFTLGREELPGMIQEVRRQDPDLVVLISHLGFPQDMQLLTEVPGVDVCLSGHTHNRLYEPVLAGKTLVIQAGSQGSFLGRLDLEIQDRQIVRHTYRLIEVAEDVLPDSTVEGLVRDALVPYERELRQVVGQTATPLNRGTMLESTMDNLLLASMQEATGAELAFSNGWRWGAPVVPGPIMLDDLYNIIAVDPPLSTVELTGAELKEMLEENLERTFARNPYDQMGGYVKRCRGLTFHTKIENPKGSRIQKLFVGEAEVQPDAVYPAVFVTQQGVPAQFGRNRQDLAKHAIDALRAYLAKHNPARAELTGSVIAE